METNEITWEHLVRAEPRLAVLLAEVQAIKDPGGKSFCANRIWYGEDRRSGLRARLSHLWVGMRLQMRRSS
jgi:hypothetical protein